MPRIVTTGVLFFVLTGCGTQDEPVIPRLHWYVFDEPSGVFEQAARRCTQSSNGTYQIDLTPLPADADQQREQLVRRLAARDGDIDLIGMDVIWTAEFAEAGWILPWTGELAEQAREGRIASTVKSATYRDRLWAVPFTTNTQLLWYRTDRVPTPPATWEEMIRTAEQLGDKGTIQAQGERYEGLTVLFTSLLASAGGNILDTTGDQAELQALPLHRALEIMSQFANSPASDPALSTAREDQARLSFENGDSSFMINYTFVWPSARANAPEIAQRMAWARWPAVIEGQPSRVTIGGINLGVGTWSRHPVRAFQAAACLAAEENQRLAAAQGGLPPSIEKLYDDPEVRATFPFADVLRATLRDAVQRPQTPVYNDISLAISRTLHPLKAINPERDAERLKRNVERALRSEGLM